MWTVRWVMISHNSVLFRKGDLDSAGGLAAFGRLGLNAALLDPRDRAIHPSHVGAGARKYEPRGKAVA